MIIIAPINTFEAENEKVEGIDQDAKWYVALLEPEYSHNWMHLLATTDLPNNQGTQFATKKEANQKSSDEETIVPLRMFNLLKQPQKYEGVVHVKSNLHWLSMCVPLP